MLTVVLGLVVLTGCTQPLNSDQSSSSSSSTSTSKSSQSSSPTPSPSTETPTPTPTPTPSATRPPEPKAFNTLEPTKPQKTIALSFDDGPSEYTLEILKILNQFNVKATFFVIGSQVSGNESILQELKNSGMSIQSHTWAHADLKTLSAGAIAEDLSKANQVIKSVVGDEVGCVRPPYGSVNSTVSSAIANLGMEMKMWDIDPQDWKLPGTNSIASNIQETHKDGGVILLHDGGGNRAQTVAALPSILDFLKSQEYKITIAC